MSDNTCSSSRGDWPHLSPLPSASFMMRCGMHSPPPLILAHPAVVLAITWKHGKQHSATLREVMEQQGPPARWSNRVTFSQRYPLLAPQLTSTSAPPMQEKMQEEHLPCHLSVLSLFPFIIFCPGTPKFQEITILFR